MDEKQTVDRKISENIQNAITLNQNVENDNRIARREAWSSLNTHKKDVFRLVEIGNTLPETVHILAASGLNTDEEMLLNLVGIKITQKRASKLFSWFLLSGATSLIMAIISFGSTSGSGNKTPTSVTGWLNLFAPVAIPIAVVITIVLAKKIIKCKSDIRAVKNSYMG